MSSIFNTTDVATLVAAFPPVVQSTKDKPYLLRARSRRTVLLRSDAIVEKLRRLLESTGRDVVKLADLQSELDVAQDEWLLDCCDEGTLRYSADRQSLLTAARIEKISRLLHKQLSDGCVDVTAFASAQDIARESIDCLIADAVDDGSVTRLHEDGRDFVARKQFTSGICERVERAIEESGEGIVDLSDLLSGIPRGIALSLCNEAMRRHESTEGSLLVEGAHIKFVPSAYVALQQSQNEERRRSRRAELAHALDVAGYCIVDPREWTVLAPDMDAHEIANEVTKLSQDGLGGSDPIIIERRDSGETVIVSKDAVESTMTLLKKSARDLAHSDEHDRNESLGLTQNDERWLIDKCPELEVARSLLQEPFYRSTIEDVLKSTLSEILDVREARFKSLFHEKLAAPVQLYSDGVTSIDDITLRERQDVHIREHFTHEVLPRFMNDARDQKLLHDRSRGREVNRLMEACREAKTIGAIRNVVVRFSRKQKLGWPDEAQRDRVMLSLLKQNVRAVRKTTRGSDILQNLIWILLAREHRALYVSAGRDTSRMIKQFERHGAAEVATKLQHWRDQLKEGDVDAEALDEMKNLASTVVDSIGAASV